MSFAEELDDEFDIAACLTTSCKISASLLRRLRKRIGRLMLGAILSERAARMEPIHVLVRQHVIEDICLRAFIAALVTRISGEKRVLRRAGADRLRSGIESCLS